jgi:hypothetical protein
MNSILGTINTIGRVPTGLEERQRQEYEAANQRWPEAKPADIEQIGHRLFADKASGNLYTPVITTVLHGKFKHNPAADRVSFFTANGDGSLTFFERSTSGPTTLDELHEQDAERQRAEDEQEARHREFIAAQPLRPYCLYEIEPGNLPTLREAARAVTNCGGRLEADGGNLVVLLPETLDESPIGDRGKRDALKPAIKVIVAAKDVVLAELAGSKKPLDPDRLPDRHALVAGGVAS